MAWSHRKNARHRNSKKDVVRKAVCNKTKRKTKNEMAGWRVHGPEKDGNKWMERESEGSRGLEAYCKGGQGPPRAVAPPKKIFWVIRPCNLVFWVYTCLACPHFLFCKYSRYSLKKEVHVEIQKSKYSNCIFAGYSSHKKKTTINSFKGTWIP